MPIQQFELENPKVSLPHVALHPWDFQLMDEPRGINRLQQWEFCLPTWSSSEGNRKQAPCSNCQLTVPSLSWLVWWQEYTYERQGGYPYLPSLAGHLSEEHMGLLGQDPHLLANYRRNRIGELRPSSYTKESSRWHTNSFAWLTNVLHSVNGALDVDLWFGGGRKYTKYSFAGLPAQCICLARFLDWEAVFEKSQYKFKVLM